MIITYHTTVAADAEIGGELHSVLLVQREVLEHSKGAGHQPIRLETGGQTVSVAR